MRHLRYVILGSTLGAAVACASAPPATGDEPAADVAAAGSSRPDELVWSGSLQPTQERTGTVAPTKQNKAYGTVRLRPTPRDLNRTAVNIVISTPLQEPSALRWALLPGRCGAASLPVMGYELFPIVEVGTNGRGELTAEIPFTLPYDGSFHVNVYWGDRSQPGSARLQSVLTCANLRRSG
ncbi:MAG: hypothetical protein ACT4PJ_17200 [Gemmatimonadaceae bacterium]